MMADNWRVLDFSSYSGVLYYDSMKRRLRTVEQETGEITEQALSDINIVLIGIHVTVSSGVMYHFSEDDVVVLFCDWKGLPISAVYPWCSAHSRIAARQRAQANMSVPRTKNAWMRIVKAKINGQASNLDFFEKKNSEKLKRLATSTRSGDPSNNEAQAAKLYWSSLFSDQTFRREPGCGRNDNNAWLDYGYTVLRGHSVRAVLSAGLAPTLGVFHKGRANAFALADDLIEPFRPAIDYAVVSLGTTISEENSAQIRRELLKSSVGLFSTAEETRDSIPSAMIGLAQLYGRYVEGEVEYLDVPEWHVSKLENDENYERM